ncbi:hypothetical protein F2981_29425 (plasmid) [Sinorhizobium meliloti]|nr:hypothetical protein [Sinorhizobium meliloti]
MGFFRIFGGRVVVIPAATDIVADLSSCPGQHLAFQEIVTRTPLHLALDHLEAIDLPLDRLVLRAL